MAFKSRFHAFAAKVETTPGQDASPSMTTDAIRLFEPGTVEEFYVAENRTDDVSTGGVGVALFAMPSGRAIRLTLRWVPIGAGVAYGDPSPVPEGAALLRSAGFGQTIDATVGAEKVTYDAQDDPNTTVTAIFQVSGLQYKAVGCVTESFRLTCEAGSFPIIEQTLVGTFTGPTTQTLQTPTFDAVTWPILASAGAVSIGGASGLVVRSLSLDLGLGVAQRTDANTDTGFLGSLIMRRAPVLQVVGEVVALTSWNPSADWSARTQRTIDVRFGKAGAPGQYARLNIVADDARVVRAQDGDLDGLRVWTVDYLCSRPANPPTEKELSFVFD